MKIKKLNKTYTVFQHGHARWVAMFFTEKAFMNGIIQMYDSFGAGSPFTGYISSDSGHPWLFRQMSPEKLTQGSGYHAIYLTSEEQITLLSLAYSADD